MAQETLKVRGYTEFLRAVEHADKDIKREVRSIYRAVGDIVRNDARQRISSVSTVSAAGYHTTVRLRGVAVEAKKKTTGQHPEYGAYQMRHALLPALDDNEARIEREFAHAVDLVADVFAYGSY